MDAYRFDQAQLCEAGWPAVVVLPRTTAEVQHVLSVAGEFGVPVVPQGARTGLSGGANAIDGCIVLSMTRMDRIVEIDEVDQVAVVQPGVVNATLSRAVLERGLFYAPDPSSWELSTIGGNVSTNAGGLCCVKYGVTADFVRGLEVVLASGEVLRTGVRTAKGVAGYDLTRLLVGSEGTLGVITEVTVALRSAPEAALTAAAVFPNAGSAMAAVTAVMASGVRPSMLEFVDGVTIRAIQAYRDMGLPDTAGALLIVRSDRGARAAEDLDLIATLSRGAGALEVAVADTPAEGELLMEARRLVVPAIERLGAVMFEDVAVPRARLVELLAGVNVIAERNGIVVACCGHAGDGNMHPAIVTDRGDRAAVTRARAAFDEIMTLALSLGGTITGEHGVGLLKRQALSQELGMLNQDLQRQIRSVFDPHGILNPGKVFD